VERKPTIHEKVSIFYIWGKYMIEFLLNRWVVLIIGVIIMLVGLKPEWTLAVVKMVGMMGWAENRVGRGGTFTVWKIIGILAPIVAIIYFFSGGIQLNRNNDTGSVNSGQSSDYNTYDPSIYQ